MLNNKIKNLKAQEASTVKTLNRQVAKDLKPALEVLVSGLSAKYPQFEFALEKPKGLSFEVKITLPNTDITIGTITVDYSKFADRHWVSIQEPYPDHNGYHRFSIRLENVAEHSVDMPMVVMRGAYILLENASRKGACGYRIFDNGKEQGSQVTGGADKSIVTFSTNRKLDSSWVNYSNFKSVTQGLLCAIGLVETANA